MVWKEFEEEDPLEFLGVGFSDPEGKYLREMAATFIEEFMRIGWRPADIMGFFRNPFYKGPNIAYKRLGEETVRKIISEVSERLGR